MSVDYYDENYLEFYDNNKCIGDLGEKWCNFKWRIYNLQLSPQDIVRSPVFTTRLLPKTRWYLEVKLLLPSDLHYMNVSLRRLQSNEKQSSIVDVIYKVDCGQEIKISDKRTVMYDNENIIAGTCNFNAPFYKSKTEFIIIECKLRPNKLAIKNVCHDNLDEALPVDLRRLLQSGELCDTVIEVGNQRFMIHFVILCARLQDYIRTNLPNPPEEGEKCVIKIDDLPVSVVKEMVKYLYTGQAYLDLDSVAGYKDKISAYSKDFLRACFWEDNPIAETFFNYEFFNSVSWYIPDNFTRSDIARRGIDLLRIYPSSIELSLDILEREEEKRGLTLTIKFCTKVMPKPTVVFCKYYLLNKVSDEKFELGEKEVLLQSDTTQAKVKLCSLLEVKRVRSVLCATENMTLEIDFKFCYGSTKSSIKDLYEGQFDISKCTSCELLSRDMEHLRRFVSYTDITLGAGESKIAVHKAVLIARWLEAKEYKVKESRYIELEDCDYQELDEFVKQLYTGCSIDPKSISHR